ncbi:ImmA/IrrE family metallo-endopeptidase [Baekduia sp. Peel2402]|uniref:ImmA/IrrE family metallo-endopeptidase n=1 Tax=Baekduia sp. Peel2402 TaxID=3458296 RepID=UPI00403E9BA9
MATARTSDPRRAALALLSDFEARFDPGSVPPVPVERIAESHLGLLIEEVDDVRTIEGAPTDEGRLSGLLDPAARTIWLDRREAARSPGRRRFTIAHECAHWVLHVAGAAAGAASTDGCRVADVAEQDEDGTTTRARGRTKREAEANAFARELLMPELLLIAEIERTGHNLPALAERFGVSVPALRLRLLTLKLLPAWMASAPVAERGGERR